MLAVLVTSLQHLWWKKLLEHCSFWGSKGNWQPYIFFENRRDWQEIKFGKAPWTRILQNPQPISMLPSLKWTNIVPENRPWKLIIGDVNFSSCRWFSTSWFFQPMWTNMLVKLDHLARDRRENSKHSQNGGLILISHGRKNRNHLHKNTKRWFNIDFPMVERIEITFTKTQVLVDW